MADYLVFEPKAGGPAWRADVDPSYAESGFDIVVFLDVVDGKTNCSGWMLELTVGPNGLIAGSITSDPGNDALALFRCYPDRMDISDNWGGPTHVLPEQVKDRQALLEKMTEKLSSRNLAREVLELVESHGWD